MSQWLQEAREAARQAAQREDRLHYGLEAESVRDAPFSYRWEHVQQVVRNGEWLLTQISADRDVVLAACWLHDIRKMEPSHAERGAEFAREFLPTTDFPRDKIETVAQAILPHEGLFRPAPDWNRSSGTPFRAAPPIEPIEAAIVWDADKLSKIGPVGFLHFLPSHVLLVQAKQKTMTTDDFATQNRRWLDETAPRIIASLNTVAAQTRARRLQASVELFWESAYDALGVTSPSHPEH